MKKIGYIALTAAAMAGSSVAQAQFAPPPPGTNPTPPWYIGGGVGQGHLNRSPGDLGLNDATLDKTIRRGRFGAAGGSARLQQSSSGITISDATTSTETSSAT